MISLFPSYSASLLPPRLVAELHAQFGFVGSVIRNSRSTSVPGNSSDTQQSLQTFTRLDMIDQTGVKHFSKYSIRQIFDSSLTNSQSWDMNNP